jgi:hypothetical protein
MKTEDFNASIVRVGDGRGFVVSGRVITAAHCIITPEPERAGGWTENNLRQNILGKLSKPNNVWAQIEVFSAMDDLAVLCEPDNQEISEECERYRKLIEPSFGFRIGATPLPNDLDRWGDAPEIEVYLLSLADNDWHRCTAQSNGRGALILHQDSKLIKSGMSGSPILDAEGNAIGLISTTSGNDFSTHPSLSDCLPPWLLRDLDKTWDDDDDEEEAA